MHSTPQQVMNALQTLSPTEQQEVLDFVEFLQNKQRKQSLSQPEQESAISALDLAGNLVGSLEGDPPDLHALRLVEFQSLNGEIDRLQGILRTEL